MVFIEGERHMTSLALVGCAHIHTPGFVNMLKKRDDVKVKAAWDPDIRRSSKFAGDLSAVAVEKVEAIWNDADIQGVIICSETNRHEALVNAATKAKKHLFVEKPLGLASKDGYAMADAIEQAGVLFQTGYFMRGDAKVRFIRDQVKAGGFGKITRIRGSNCHGGALGGWFDSKPNDIPGDWRWMADPKISGVGGFGDLGTHSLDLMLWIMGDVEQATAQIDNGTARYEACDETGEGLMRFKNGAIGTLAAAWDDVANPVFMLLSGTEAHAAIINGKLEVKSASGELEKQAAGVNEAQPWPHAFENFIDAVIGKPGAAEKLVGAREAAYRSAVMEAMYEGARNNAWIAPQESRIG